MPVRLLSDYCTRPAIITEGHWKVSAGTAMWVATFRCLPMRGNFFFGLEDGSKKLQIVYERKCANDRTKWSDATEIRTSKQENAFWRLIRRRKVNSRMTPGWFVRPAARLATRKCKRMFTKHSLTPNWRGAHAVHVRHCRWWPFDGLKPFTTALRAVLVGNFWKLDGGLQASFKIDGCFRFYPATPTR